VTAWDVILAVFFWLSVGSLILTVVCAGLLGWSARITTHLAEVPLPALDGWPTVSLIAPARNEERNIEGAVRSLAQLDYPSLEITIVNDRSTDRTGEILDRLSKEFPQLNIVHLQELPPGWLGKNHALQLGADRSHGEWLLFTDADIFFEPTALRRAIGYALTDNVDHLAATPDTRMPSWLLQSFVVTFAIYFSLFVRIWSIRNPRSTAHIGIGAFNLVRAEAYRAVGGHQRIKMRPDDDLKLGKIIKLGGFRQDLVDGGGMLIVHWYSSFSELVRGLEKNSFSATEYSLWFTTFSSGLSLLNNFWPFIAVFVLPGPTRWIYLLVCLTLWWMAWSAARSMKLPQSCALAFPLTVLLLVYIQWRTMLLNYWQNGIRWRDTHYSLAELRANKV
jgi:cellulose synthase/poly-beta-1,6-N-acetylglucosamine synthase-like glycosyltransferase